MTSTLIWDLPTRLFHWLLAGGVVAAAWIALGLGEHSLLFPYHAIIGLTLAVVVVFRLVWGFIGTRHARFTSFAFGPRAVLAYLKGAVLGGAKKYVGHNPGSAYAIFAMLALFVALAVTGIMLGRGIESAKEVHELCTYALLAVAGVHLVGVILHSARHRENITAGMVHGRKHADSGDGIVSAHPLVAIVLLLITGAWAYGLFRNADASMQTTKLPLLGVTLQLGEHEAGREGEHDERRGHDDEGD
ncbi:MAG: cytochrome b/b6 domain-containing protein [Phycisphaerales bacterium]|nr:cytochrome b/b6 domain-containing protein [Phycisphaerales bacterium]